MKILGKIHLAINFSRALQMLISLDWVTSFFQKTGLRKELKLAKKIVLQLCAQRCSARYYLSAEHENRLRSQQQQDNK